MYYNERILAIAGDIKVNVQDIRLLYIAINNNDSNYMDFFEKKYLCLTSIRIEEKQAYENYKIAKKILKEENDVALVKELQKEYMQIRNKRIGLQNEISEYEKEKSILVNNEKQHK